MADRPVAAIDAVHQRLLGNVARSLGGDAGQGAVLKLRGLPVVQHQLDSVPQPQAVHAVDEAEEEPHGGGGQPAPDEGILLGGLEQAGVLAHLRIKS